MTDLHKAVVRRSREPFAHYHRRIIASLEPGDLLAMRLERSRTTYRAPLAAVFRQLAQWHAEAHKQRRTRQRRGFRYE